MHTEASTIDQRPSRTERRAHSSPTRATRGTRACARCGARAARRDETGAVLCARGRGCARRPPQQERRHTFASGRSRVAYQYEGGWHSVRALAALAKLPLRFVARRLRRGWTVVDAMSVPRRRGAGNGESCLGRAPQGPGRPQRFVAVRGERLPVQQWAARLEVTRAALYGLANRRGLTIEQLIESMLLEPS